MRAKRPMHYHLPVADLTPGGPQLCRHRIQIADPEIHHEPAGFRRVIRVCRKGRENGHAAGTVYLFRLSSLKILSDPGREHAKRGVAATKRVDFALFSHRRLR